MRNIVLGSIDESPRTVDYRIESLFSKATSYEKEIVSLSITISRTPGFATRR